MSGKKAKIGKKVECPECGFRFKLESSLEVDDILDCPDCGVSMEVMALAPPRVKLVDDEWSGRDVPDEELDYDHETRMRW